MSDYHHLIAHSYRNPGSALFHHTRINNFPQVGEELAQIVEACKKGDCSDSDWSHLEHYNKRATPVMGRGCLIDNPSLNRKRPEGAACIASPR
ncbi:hypothetical protein AVEN_184881-1 [Araneus ventricosus]|uniref:Uncharacterized protein n=1 Tax=Araneus ventricosus TaxID=182803 RepID=A0A4Y2GEG2_ARAVE|nr:hypothetical protein AVEN_184881-1 [Araneus ventricosus]